MPQSKRSWMRWLVGVLIVLAASWVAFFDSHSLVKRLRFNREYTRLAQENRRMRQEIEALRETLRTPPSDATIERIAREQYGMRRPGETVYRVEER